MSAASMFYESQFPVVRTTRSLGLSLAIHGVVATLLLVGHHAIKSTPASAAHVTLVAPATDFPRKRLARALPPRKTFAPKLVTPVRAPLPLAAPPPAIARTQAPITLPTAPRIQEPTAIAPPSAIALAPPPIDSHPRLEVRTGGFEAASTAQASTAVPKATYSSGFGDAAISRSGAARGAVAASGFGDAATASASIARHPILGAGGFGDVMTTSAPAPARLTSGAAPVTAAQILDKPRPVYTEEARRLQIEGEVQIELIFGASGEIHILRVVQGLGHGLDENAVHAAKAIRFLPAKRDGHAVDSTARVHIIFQLAS